MEKESKSIEVECFIDRIITTCNVMKITPSGIIITDKDKGIPKTRQTVLAVGPNASVKVGDEVEIDFDKFPRRPVDPNKSKYTKNGIGPDNYEIFLPIETIDGVDYLFICMSHIKWKYIKTK
jgi:hypothetical protein